MSDLSLTAEQLQHAREVIGRNIDLAARRDASGRSSLPITIDDLLLLAGLSMHALADHTADQGPRQDAGGSL